MLEALLGLFNEAVQHEVHRVDVLFSRLNDYQVPNLFSHKDEALR
jgi:hypothetical protein